MAAAPTTKSREAKRGRRRGGAALWLRRFFLLLVVIVATPLVLAPLYHVVNPVSTLMIGRWATLQSVDRRWVPLEQIDSDVMRSVLASEDAQFCRHFGIDVGALKEVIDDYRAGKRVRGASTLAMQTAKNLFLWPQRSYVRKVLELPLAVYLDAVLGKRRLLEVYLNIAEWGPDGQFGIEAGAQRAFGKPAIDLTRREAALLTVMLPNPIDRDAANPSGRLRSLAGTVEARGRSESLDVSCLGL